MPKIRTHFIGVDPDRKPGRAQSISYFETDCLRGVTVADEQITGHFHCFNTNKIDKRRYRSLSPKVYNMLLLLSQKRLTSFRK